MIHRQDDLGVLLLAETFKELHGQGILVRSGRAQTWKSGKNGRGTETAKDLTAVEKFHVGVVQEGIHKFKFSGIRKKSEPEFEAALYDDNELSEVSRRGLKDSSPILTSLPTA
jgi:hypothetical protein